MSILLEAVKRSKQQELEVDLDPVLTPRAQYDDFTRPKKRLLMLSLIVIILALLTVIVWLARDHFTSDKMVSAQAPNEERAIQVRPLAPLSEGELERASHDINPGVAPSGDGDKVTLAGKVALPLAVAFPAKPEIIESRYPETAPAQQESVQQQEASVVEVAQRAAEKESAAAEPIILGANSNHRGQQVLDSLKYQVDTAAAELGMDRAQVKPESSGQYQSKNNLLAAFEAALKEVEVEKSVASSVSEPELDPIPAPKQDNLPKYGQLPAGLQLQVPEFNIKAHVYSSDPSNRWLNVDGAELQQGDMIGGKLEIVEIRPRDVVLAIDGTEFKVPAI